MFQFAVFFFSLILLGEVKYSGFMLFISLYQSMDKKPVPTIPLRKDIRFLRKSQRERFFYCIKFLSVLPPQQKGNLRNFNVAWKIQNGQRYYKNMSPRNIHDQFISSHQTCCEHGTIYFAYYHRHLMTCFEIALNFADQVLIAGKSRLPASLYTPYAKSFDAVFDRYQKIISGLRIDLGLSAKDDLPQVSAHYWNPVDYTTSISIPEQIQERQPDVIDKLYNDVNSHYPWEFNFATRWFSAPGSQPRLPVNFETMGYFSSQEATYSDQERKVVYGTLNPRSTAQNQFFGVESIDQYGLSLINNKASDINLWKNYKKLRETGSKINICTLDQSQLNTLFGSKVKNLHWISTKEKEQISKNNSAQASAYNKSLPHFQFAYALYKQSNIFIKDYVATSSVNAENSMQNSHNTMHNILQLFMSDSQLSITNPLFFLYHSWIDYELEVKIRMIRTDPKKNKSEYLYTKSFLDSRIKPFSVLDQVTGSGQVKYGDYYIFEWANPSTRFYPQFRQPLTKNDYQAAFKARNFIINDETGGIRRTDELSAFYKKEYLPIHGQRYAYFKNFSKFNFDYNYQIHDYDKDGNRVPIEMNGNTVVVPRYIVDIYDDYDVEWNQNRTHTITPPKLASYEQQDPQQVAMNNSLKKEIRMNIGGYATYPSSIKSSSIPIELKATEKGLKTLNMSHEYLQMLKKGIVLLTASIFSRGVGSEICPNCIDEKEYFIFGSQKLAEINQELFCQLSQNLIQKTYYKTKDNKLQPIQVIDVKELLTLSTPWPVFSRLQLEAGAFQVDFVVEFKGKHSSVCEVALTLFSYCVQTDKLQNLVTRKKEILNNVTFQFPKVFGLKEGKSHYRYVYRHVEGAIVNGDERCDFSFDIKARSRLITFLILVEEKFDSNNEGYLDVEIVDKNYDFKIRQFATNDS